MAMELLKNILDAELYKQFETAVNAYNGNEANKDKQIKLANLATGDYVSKLKYEDIAQQLTGKQTELDTANGLIADLKKGAKGNEEMQGKIATYEADIAKLQEQLAQTKLEGELKVALLEAKATDIDYMTFKLKEKGEALELGDDGHIKGIDDLIAGLKTQFPTQFETAKNNGKVIDVLPLPKSEGGNNSLTKADILKKPYAERMEIYNENPEAYKEIMKS